MQCPDCGDTGYVEMKQAHDPEYMELIKARDKAHDTYMMMIKAAPPVRDRTKEQQRMIDDLLGVYQAFARSVWHYGIEK